MRADYLTRFLADPLATEPGTTMPDLLGDLEDPGRARAAEELAHYLRSFSAPNAASSTAAESMDRDAAKRGRDLFHTIGCVGCHAPRDDAGAEVALPGSVPLAPLSAKYWLPALRAFLLAPYQARPAGRMPDLNLSPAEANDLSHYLLGGTPVDETPAQAVDGDKVAAGRNLFAERGCVHCHALPDPERAPPRTAAPLGELDPAKGCMSGVAGSWPVYALTEEQRADLAAAMHAVDTPLDDEARILQRLASRNCLACHARGEVGGVSKERARFFTSLDPTLGPEGRLPPPLTGVGAKLQHDWLVDAIAHGQSVRPYVRTRMPGFGSALATELAAAFEKVDELPPQQVRPLPEKKKEARAIVDLGRELIGDKGMNCISCHEFAGKRVGAMGAVDLVDSTGHRLHPEWFVQFLRTPLQFKPGTLMPQFFPGGVSVRPELGEGDAAGQIEAMWHYLAKGRNVRKPRGIRRPPIELTVGDEAVMLRRTVQNTGKRGISVGYPGGVNLTFDAESLGLNQIWWGGFVDAAPVWTGQGSGQARILGRQRVALPLGPAFVVLPDPDTPWPSATRRELGQRWLGYDLDTEQRPSFRYVCDDVEVTDTPREKLVDGGVELRRALRLTSTVDKTLYFRAARDARIDDLGDGRVQVGRSLHMKLPPESFRIRSAGDERELLVAIPIRRGQAELVVEYSWHQEGK